MRTMPLFALATTLAFVVGCGAPADATGDDLAASDEALVSAGGSVGGLSSAVTSSNVRPLVSTKVLAPCNAYVVEAPRADGAKPIRDLTTGLRWLAYRFPRPQTRNDAAALCASRGARLATQAELMTIVGVNACEPTFTAAANAWFAGGWSSTTTSTGQVIAVVANGDLVKTSATATVFQEGYGGVCLF